MEQKIFFGTDGWRGLLDTEINIETVKLVGQAFADYLIEKYKENISIVIGYDGRRNSKLFAVELSKVLSGNHIKVFLSEKIEPTPVLSYYVKANNLQSGIMVTASHNPAKYNGLKFKADYGGPFFTEETLKVEKLIGNNKVKQSEENITITNLRLQYLQQIKNYINFEIIKKSGVRVLIDSMGGAGQQIIESLLSEYHIPSRTIYKVATEDFSGRYAEPIDKNLFQLKTELTKENFSLGLATDGDADRIGIVQDNAEWLSAQETILLLADFLVNKKKLSGDIVKTSSVTDKIIYYFAKDRTIHDVQVGFKYICEKMIENNVAFGAEESGGFGYQNHIPERDGILSGLLITEMLASSGYTKLSDYVKEKTKEFGEIYYDRIDLEYDKPDRINILPSLKSNPPEKISDFYIKSFNEYYSSRGIINGIKFFLEGASRWLLLRASETEPLIRIYAEAESNEEVHKILQAGISFFK
ncbi:MAG TPA: phosphoglucomutase [Ignavibacteriaceae bacterium]|nr:phosphoglucomutase [Ignavibacteriaceae bacterium]